MSPQQFLSILKARWLTALLILVITVAVSVAVSMNLKKQYTATASVMLDVASPDPIAGFVMSAMTSSSYMATQVDLITSERVARRAIGLLKLSEEPATRAAWQIATKGRGDYLAWLSDMMGRALDVKPSRESNVINISYSADDAAVAAASANAFVQAYVDTSLELRVDPARQYNSFFDARAKQLRDDLEAAQTRLSAYQREHGIIPGTDGRLDIESARLSELSTQLVLLQTIAAESSGRQAQAGTRPEQLAEVLSNPVVSQLSAELAREETRMKELNLRLGENHPQLLEQRARVGELKARIDTATRRASGSIDVNNSVNQGRVAQVRGALEAQRATILRLKELRDQAAVLQRDVENAQRAYDAVLQRVNQTSLESKSTQTNISIVKTASPPAFPSSPRVVLNTAIAIVIGLVLGLGSILFGELFDRRLRTSQDVLTELKQPLLVTLPISKYRALGADNSRVRMVKARVLTGLPRPTAKA